MEFKADFEITDEQKEKYLAAIAKEKNCKIEEISSVKATLNKDDTVDLDFQIDGRKFERIRRIK